MPSPIVSATPSAPPRPQSHVELFDPIAPNAFGASLAETLKKWPESFGELPEEDKAEADSLLQKLNDLSSQPEADRNYQSQRDPKKLWDKLLQTEAGEAEGSNDERDEMSLELHPAQAAYLASKLYEEIQDSLFQIAENGQVPASQEQDALAIKMALLAALTEKIVSHYQSENSAAQGAQGGRGSTSQSQNIQIKWQDLEPILYVTSETGGKDESNASPKLRPVIAVQQTEGEESQPNQSVLYIARSIVYENVSKLPNKITAGGLGEDAQPFVKIVGEASQQTNEGSQEEPQGEQPGRGHGTGQVQTNQTQTGLSATGHGGEQGASQGGEQASASAAEGAQSPQARDLDAEIRALAQELDNESGSPTVHKLYDVQQAWQSLRQNVEDQEASSRPAGIKGKVKGLLAKAAKWILGAGLEGKAKFWHAMARAGVIVGLSVFMPGGIIPVLGLLGIGGGAAAAEAYYQLKGFNKQRQAILEKLNSLGVENAEKFEKLTSRKQRTLRALGSAILGAAFGAGVGFVASMGLVPVLGTAIAGFLIHRGYSKLYESSLRHSIETLKQQALESLTHSVENTKEAYEYVFSLEGPFWATVKKNEDGSIEEASAEECTHIKVKGELKAPLLSALQIMALAQDKLNLTDEQKQKLEQLMSQVQQDELISKELLTSVFGQQQNAFNLIDKIYSLVNSSDVEARKVALNILDSLRAVLSGAQVIEAAFSIENPEPFNNIEYTIDAVDLNKFETFLQYFKELYLDANVEELLRVIPLEGSTESRQQGQTSNTGESSTASEQSYKVKLDLYDIVQHIANNWHNVPDNKLLSLVEMLYAFGDIAVITAASLAESKPEVAGQIQKIFVFTNNYNEAVQEIITSGREFATYRELNKNMEELVASALGFLDAIYGATSVVTRGGFKLYNVNPHISAVAHNAEASMPEAVNTPHGSGGLVLADVLKPENNAHLQALGSNLHAAGFADPQHLHLDIVTHGQHHVVNGLSSLGHAIKAEDLQNAQVFIQENGHDVAKLVIDKSGEVLALPVQGASLSQDVLHEIARFDALQLGLKVQDLSTNVIETHLQGVHLPSGVDSKTVASLIQQHIPAGHVAFVDSHGHLLDFSFQNGQVVYTDHGNVQDLVSKALEHVKESMEQQLHGPNAGTGTNHSGVISHKISLDKLLAKGSQSNLDGHVFQPNNNIVHLHPGVYGQHAAFAVLHENFGSMPPEVQHAIVKAYAIDQGWGDNQDRALFVLAQKIVNSLQAHGGSATTEQIAKEIFNKSPALQHAFVSQFGDQTHAFEAFKDHVIAHALGAAANTSEHIPSSAPTAGISPSELKMQLGKVLEHTLASSSGITVSTSTVEPGNALQIFVSPDKYDNISQQLVAESAKIASAGVEQAMSPSPLEANSAHVSMQFNGPAYLKSLLGGFVAGGLAYSAAEIGLSVFAKFGSGISNNETLRGPNLRAELTGITSPEGLSDEEKQAFESFIKGLKKLSWYKLPNGSLGLYEKYVISFKAEGPLKGARAMLGWVRAGSATTGAQTQQAQAQTHLQGQQAQTQQAQGQAQNQQLVYGKDLLPVIIVQSADGNRVVIPIDFNAVQEQHNGNLQKYLEAQIDQRNVVSMSSSFAEVTKFNSFITIALKKARQENKEVSAIQFADFLNTFVDNIVPLPKGANVKAIGRVIRKFRKDKVEEAKQLREQLKQLLPQKLLTYDADYFEQVKDQDVLTLNEVKEQLIRAYSVIADSNGRAVDYWNSQGLSLYYQTADSGQKVLAIESNNAPIGLELEQALLQVDSNIPNGAKISYIMLPEDSDLDPNIVRQGNEVKGTLVLAIKVPKQDGNGFNFVILDAIKGQFALKDKGDNNADIQFKADAITTSPFNQIPAVYERDEDDHLKPAPLFRVVEGSNLEQAVEQQAEQLFGNKNNLTLLPLIHKFQNALHVPYDVVFADDRILEVTKDSATVPTEPNPAPVPTQREPNPAPTPTSREPNPIEPVPSELELPKPNSEDIEAIKQTFESVLSEEAKLITQAMPRNLLTAFILSLQVEGIHLEQEEENEPVKLVIPHDKIDEVKARLAQRTKLGKKRWYYKLALSMFHAALESAGDGDVIISDLVKEQLANVAGIEPTGSSLQDIEEALKQATITSMEQFKETKFYKEVLKPELLKFINIRLKQDNIQLISKPEELDLKFTSYGLKVVGLSDNGGKKPRKPVSVELGEKGYKAEVIEFNLNRDRVIITVPISGWEAVSTPLLKRNAREPFKLIMQEATETIALPEVQENVLKQLKVILAPTSEHVPKELEKRIRDILQTHGKIRLKIEPVKNGQYRVMVQGQEQVKTSSGKRRKWIKLGSPIFAY